MIKINYSTLFLSLVFIGLVVYSNCQEQGLCRKRNKSNGGLFEHGDYCDYYWRCDSKKGEPYLQACPNGLVFVGKGRGLFEYCGYPHEYNCPDEKRYMAQEPVSSENCPYSYGIFPHKTSCSKYYQCWNNTANEQKCGFSLLYNDDLHACDWPSNVKDCQKHPVCKDTPDGLVLLKGSCILYWRCVGGYPRLERCPAGLAVNPDNLKCELANLVPSCAAKVTTPKYEDENEKKNENEKKKEEEKKAEINEKKPEKKKKRKNDKKAEKKDKKKN